jgi:hypothetical protein
MKSAVYGDNITGPATGSSINTITHPGWSEGSFIIHGIVNCTIYHVNNFSFIVVYGLNIVAAKDDK